MKALTALGFVAPYCSGWDHCCLNKSQLHCLFGVLICSFLALPFYHVVVSSAWLIPMHGNKGAQVAAKLQNMTYNICLIKHQHCSHKREASAWSEPSFRLHPLLMFCQPSLCLASQLVECSCTYVEEMWPCQSVRRTQAIGRASGDSWQAALSPPDCSQITTWQ